MFFVHFCKVFSVYGRWAEFGFLRRGQLDNTTGRQFAISAKCLVDCKPGKMKKPLIFTSETVFHDQNVPYGINPQKSMNKLLQSNRIE